VVVAGSEVIFYIHERYWQYRLPRTAINARWPQDGPPPYQYGYIKVWDIAYLHALYVYAVMPTLELWGGGTGILMILE
jgi:hypothetical protein